LLKDVFKGFENQEFCVAKTHNNGIAIIGIQYENKQIKISAAGTVENVAAINMRASQN